jgi:hypothetical protein
MQHALVCHAMPLADVTTQSREGTGLRGFLSRPCLLGHNRPRVSPCPQVRAKILSNNIQSTETVSMAMPWGRTIYLSKGHGVETSYEKQVLALRFILA